MKTIWRPTVRPGSPGELTALDVPSKDLFPALGSSDLEFRLPSLAFRIAEIFRRDNASVQHYTSGCSRLTNASNHVLYIVTRTEFWLRDSNIILRQTFNGYLYSTAKYFSNER